MPMHPRPMTPTSGPLRPSVVVRMLCALLGGVTDQSAASRRGQAYLLDVEPGLHLAQHDVVDAALVAPSHHGGQTRQASMVSAS
jgi:hypothetical protein